MYTCRSGARSEKARELNEIGIDNAFNLTGGMLVWKVMW
jgi:rhodanese-related sulfurtransferase